MFSFINFNSIILFCVKKIALESLFGGRSWKKKCARLFLPYDDAPRGGGIKESTRLTKRKLRRGQRQRKQLRKQSPAAAGFQVFALSRNFSLCVCPVRLFWSQQGRVFFQMSIKTFEICNKEITYRKEIYLSKRANINFCTNKSKNFLLIVSHRTCFECVKSNDKDEY